MNAFPREIKRIGRKIVLDEEQETWLRKWYPTIENYRLAEAMGISISKLSDFSKALSLKKSAAGKAAIMRRSRKAAAKTNELNGCYDRKRGHPVSAATRAGIMRRCEEERKGIRENAQVRIRREEPEKYKLWAEKRSVKRKEQIRKEKLRILYGLERKTKLKSVVMCPYKRSQIHHRINALRRGYLLDEDCHEGSQGRYVIYYDKYTIRSERFEKNCVADGFEIMKS